MHVSTILSRHTRAKAKTLSLSELKEKFEESTTMAIKWMTIPGGTEQANKYWDAVSFYENLIEKMDAKTI